MVAGTPERFTTLTPEALEAVPLITLQVAATVVGHLTKALPVVTEMVAPILVVAAVLVRLVETQLALLEDPEEMVSQALLLAHLSLEAVAVVVLVIPLAVVRLVRVAQVAAETAEQIVLELLGQQTLAAAVVALKTLATHQPMQAATAVQVLSLSKSLIQSPLHSQRE